ncbi:TldD/PmbA family protein [Candidatus Margulisiibacteriota bacterium]
MDLEQLGLSILKKTQKRTTADAEVYLTHSKDTSISVLNQNIEEIKTSEEQGFSLRIVSKDKMGFAYSSDIGTEAIETCINKALANHDYNAKDSNWALATKVATAQKDLNIYDPAIEKLSLDEKIPLALTIEKAAHDFDKRISKTEQAGYQDNISTTYLLNTLGINNKYSATYCGGMADMIAEEKKQMESGNDLDFATHLNEFQSKLVGERAAQQACQMLGARIPDTQKCNIVLSAEVGIQFLALLSSLFLASNVQKGKSLFAHKLGQTLASTKLTLIDDGLLPKHLGTAPFDGEGTSAKNTVLLDKGVLKDYLYNIYTANKEKKSSTGNAIRANFTTLPEVAPSNIYLEPGEIPLDSLLNKAGRGVFITKVMGMHTANPISGDFSIGIAGLTIENGKLNKPVRGGAIAGNLIELIKSVTELGNDIRFLPFFGNIGSPSLLISKISLSGA